MALDVTDKGGINNFNQLLLIWLMIDQLQKVSDQLKNVIQITHIKGKKYLIKQNKTKGGKM